MFKYGTDVLSLRASTGAESPVESVKFKDGNFFYIDANPIDGTRKVKQMRTCTNLQYYDAQSHECAPCPPGYATTTFQQTSCVRCDDLWYGADPSSLEYYMAMKLCADPEADYYLNNPSAPTQTGGETTPAGGVAIDAQNLSTKISVWWIIIGVVILLLVIAIILVLILWRAYKMQQKSNKRERNQGNEEKEPRAETFELVPTHPRSSFVADSRR